MTFSRRSPTGTEEGLASKMHENCYDSESNDSVDLECNREVEEELINSVHYDPQLVNDYEANIIPFGKSTYSHL